MTKHEKSKHLYTRAHFDLVRLTSPDPTRPALTAILLDNGTAKVTDGHLLGIVGPPQGADTLLKSSSLDNLKGKNGDKLVPNPLLLKSESAKKIVKTMFNKRSKKPYANLWRFSKLRSDGKDNLSATVIDKQENVCEIAIEQEPAKFPDVDRVVPDTKEWIGVQLQTRLLHAILEYVRDNQSRIDEGDCETVFPAVKVYFNPEDRKGDKQQNLVVIEASLDNGENAQFVLMPLRW